MHELGYFEVCYATCYVLIGILVFGEHTFPAVIRQHKASIRRALRYIGGALGVSYCSFGGLKLLSMLLGS